MTQNNNDSAINIDNITQNENTMLSARQAITSSIAMALLFVLGLSLIHALFKRSTENADDIVKMLEYSSMTAGYFLLALPVWGIFDTLKRTKLYIEGPKLIIAIGYIITMSSFLYGSYQGVMWLLKMYL